MIDLKTLAEREERAIYGKMPDIAETQRLAMRYLALREQYVDFGLSNDKAYGTNKYGTADEMRAEYDAAADRLIQEMMK